MNDTSKLLEAAQASFSAGNLVLAAQQLKSVLEATPNQVAALNGLAGLAFNDRDFVGAATYYRQLRDLQPRNAQVRHNLAIALAQVQQLGPACEELQTAVALRPDFLSARLHLAWYLVDSGEVLAGCRHYVIALKQVKSPGGASTANSPQLQHLLAQGRSKLGELRVAAYRNAVADLRAEVGDEALRRIDEAVDGYAGLRTVDYAHPRQRPAAMYLPGLQPRTFFEREEFAWMSKLEAATPVIREELLALVAEDFPGFEPYIRLPSEQASAQGWSDLNNSPSWSAFHLYRHGVPNEEHTRRCPQTMRVLAGLPLMQIDRHAPEVLFSLLRPGARIPPHYGSINGRLIVHLPLIVPPNCGALQVNGEAREWREGECLVFDDSFEHEAWNNSDQVRVVMLLDIWNPQLSDAEQRAYAAALVAVDEFNVAVQSDESIKLD